MWNIVRGAVAWLNHKILGYRIKMGIGSLKAIEKFHKKELNEVTTEIGILMGRRQHIKKILSEIKDIKSFLKKELE